MTEKEKEDVLKKTFFTRQEAEQMFSCCCQRYLDLYLVKPEGEISFIVKE